MWKKQIKQLKKQVITTKTNLDKLVKTPEVANPEINFKTYCAHLQVKELTPNHIIIQSKTKTNKINVAESAMTNFSDHDFAMFDEHNSKTEYFRFGQRNLPKELRSGKYPIRAVLDLHNYTKAHALNILERFLENAQPSVCLKIIHGIGLNSANNEPVLLGTVRKYLEQHQKVLAYSYGAPQQGGMGITLVKIVST